MAAHRELIEHSKIFEKEVINISPGIYSAVGFAASNVHMIVGEDGVVIIDTTESTGAAEKILSEFRKISNSPIKTIIYTHSHRDHISGASVFAEGGNPEILAFHLFNPDLTDNKKNPTPHTALMDRTKRQFGIGLSFPDERVNLGVGPGDRPMKGLGEGYLAPSHFIKGERTEISICGIEMELVHAPGETPDHLIVWLPKDRILFGADNYYHSFPNLYAIRGTPYRDFNAWADSLDLMLSFKAEVLAPGHSRPLIGRDLVKSQLQDYRDAIKYVISACVEGMNSGLGWDEIGSSIELPESLKSKPYLKEFYGKVSWAARAYCVGTLGWFDGNPTNLNRLSPKDEAERFLRISGGRSAVLREAEHATASDDQQWALELADRLLTLNPSDSEASNLKISCLRALADKEINAAARNTYLLFAQEMEQSLKE